MNVLLISQCNKNALKETRRILDQFAERRGDRTWQTPITQAGLDTLRKLLRKKARKNTAVACHWIRGHDHSELMWVVGDASRFNIQGAVPTNTTARDILRRHDENDWHNGEDILLLTALAALLHDLGKACDAFQQRLKGKLEGRNLYRHEWISLRLFQAFVGSDDDATWLARLAEGDYQEQDWLEGLERDGLDEANSAVFSRLPPLAAALGWLVLSHHRLPLKPPPTDDDTLQRWGGKTNLQAEQLPQLFESISAEWNEIPETQDPKRIAPYWLFKSGLPVSTQRWRERATKLATRLQARLKNSVHWLESHYVMHLARLSLMLADHHYSSLEDPLHRVRGEPNYPLIANTLRKTGKPNQPLDEHILGVEKHAAAVARALPSVDSHLPRLARHKGFRKRSSHPRFRWQDKAFDLAQSLRERSQRQGFFGINMASTGCGKTLANGRIMYALADPDKGARFSIALGLRTLTLQTGQALRERLNLGEDELAVRVGGSANKALFAHYEQEAEASGSASKQALIEEDAHVVFDGNFDSHPVLRRLNDEPGTRALIAAPILVCTVDHLVPATESTRGGRQIVPMLRLMSSDLVLDEIDDFDINDLPALTRLVNWAGLLGSRVLLSSATLPPALVEGLYEAYRSGREAFQRHRGEPGLATDICCAWFDEHDRQHHDCASGETFRTAHHAFAKRRLERLSTSPVRRRGNILSLPAMGKRPEEIRPAVAELLREHALALHQQHHSVDPHTSKRVSFGLIRMANIDPLVDVARALFQQGAPEGVQLHLCVYHSRHPLVMRSEIERRLDRTLQRAEPDRVFQQPDIRRLLDSSEEYDHLFIVLGSPVTEVGRDHDYDWAIVEPSSMRSIIQLAGRVRRHREQACDVANILLLDANLKHLERPSDPAFHKPGFETSEQWRLSSHSLTKLLAADDYQVIDARPRVLARETLRAKDSLVDLEHERLHQLMIEQPAEPLTTKEIRLGKQPKSPPLGAYSWYVAPQLHLTGVMIQRQPFRQQTQKEVALALLPDESGETWTLHRVEDGERRGEKLYVQVEESLLKRIDLTNEQGERIQPWGASDYLTTLADLAEDLDISLERAARTFGIVTVSENTNGWWYHPVLGFSKRK
ncbi:type I-F CRISPR-associated helicase Cas3f [Halovibrio sp. HP20-50]|uniref:type I-F CRISPR-associated helicase Cas3f n=1 Tax=Halovibrio sp. HP20-59 TaxID=3080275 RepID=UPI00294B36C7|nr:type I-F CRISPR-associated helicase Cas3f [Halovibrio sp. HP20-59]MEA2119703.1 type I-F CRISPR-associated helicase Cas3f [Halovibrio sp. HP20-59]